MKRTVLVSTLLLLVSCSQSELSSFLGEPVEATTPPAAPPAGLEPYGLDGQLSETDIKALLYLQFPQSYEAMQDRFGFPAYRDGAADYYELPNNRWVAVDYSGATATGYRFSDSND
jgi:hypothetical protein